MPVGIAREIPPCTREQRFATSQIAARMMMKGHRHLNEPLKELPIGRRRCTPDVLEHLMGVEVVGRVEQG
jgi:hypothetical protein